MRCVQLHRKGEAINIKQGNVAAAVVTRTPSISICLPRESLSESTSEWTVLYIMSTVEQVPSGGPPPL